MIGAHGKRSLERGWQKGWQRVGERLAKGWQSVGEGFLAPSSFAIPKCLFRRADLRLHGSISAAAHMAWCWPTVGDENLTHFFLKLFGHSRDIPAKSRDMPPKSLVSLGFEGHTELFGPHSSRGRPPPHPKVSRPKSSLQTLTGLWALFSCRLLLSAPKLLLN